MKILFLHILEKTWVTQDFNSDPSKYITKEKQQLPLTLNISDLSGAAVSSQVTNSVKQSKIEYLTQTKMLICAAFTNINK